jgi:hypothetical protein
METWFRQLVQKSNWAPTVTMRVSRDELITLVSSFEAFELWDSVEPFSKRTIFHHGGGVTVRFADLEIRNNGSALETLESVFDKHEFEVALKRNSSEKVKVKLKLKLKLKPSVVKLKEVEVLYLTQFQKNKWVYDLGFKCRAASLGGIEKMICTKQGPAIHFVRIRHSDWPEYYGAHTTAHAAASLALKFQDILALLK